MDFNILQPAIPIGSRSRILMCALQVGLGYKNQIITMRRKGERKSGPYQLYAQDQLSKKWATSRILRFNHLTKYFLGYCSLILLISLSWSWIFPPTDLHRSLNNDHHRAVLQISSDQQRILITGVSGLIGRLLFRHLSEKYPEKYHVIGLDQHLKLSSRYHLENRESAHSEEFLSFPANRFFQCDITDRDRLHQIIKEQQIQIVIHLAGVLENDPDPEKISRVNIQGTKNIFEANGLVRIICASSVMTVAGYLQLEPYLSIVHNTFDDQKMLKNLRKLTVEHDPPMPDRRTPSVEAYSQSKIIGEQMAQEIMRTNRNKSIISVRFGWVNTDDRPGIAWYRALWLSHRDTCSFIDRILESPSQIFGTYFAVSNNHRLWLDLNRSRQDLNFIPQDGAEKI